MSKTAAMTLRLTPELKSKLADLAAKTDRTPSAVAQRVLGDYVDHQLWIIEEIEKSREDFRQGRTATHEDVMRQAREIIKRNKSKAA